MIIYQDDFTGEVVDEKGNWFDSHESYDDHKFVLADIAYSQAKDDGLINYVQQ